MGCGSSAITPRVGIGQRFGIERKWKVNVSRKEARVMYENEGSLPKKCVDDLLELRAFLDDPMCLSRLGSFAKTKKSLALLMFWTDVLEFKAISEESHDYQLSKCLHIYHKYIKPDAIVALRLVYISSEFIVQIQTAMDEAKDPIKNTPVSSHIFDLLHRQCLLQIYANLYTEFRATPLFRSTLREFTQQYNQVSPDDFEYLEEIGAGNFGSVIRCRKKSTGIEYAMKIQSKVQLLGAYGNSTHRILSEVKVLSSCCHPFIASMHYAFQTEALVMIVMTLGSVGTLADWQEAGGGEEGGGKRLLSEEVVRFYAAEIALALFHIHRMGMIYRDLKPANVVLNGDGHVQLVDMGGVIDVGAAGQQKMSMNRDAADDGSLGIFAAESQHFPVPESEFVVGQSSMYTPGGITPNAGSPRVQSQFPGAIRQGDNPMPRAKSIMGTCGYMAPEMMAMASSKCTDRGYTAAVDYWSLGVTMFDLLTGDLPFDNAYLVLYLEHARLNPTSEHKSAYSSHREVNSTASSSGQRNNISGGPTEVSPNFVYEGVDASSLAPLTKGVIKDFLNLEESQRLGAGVVGIRRIKAHPYFRSISWSLLAQKHVVPPFIPEKSLRTLAERPLSANLDEALSNLNYRGDLYSDNAPAIAEQEHFAHWDYIAPSMLRKEMGIETESNEADNVFKENWYNIDLTALLTNVSSSIKRAAGSIRNGVGGNPGDPPTGSTVRVSSSSSAT